MQPEVEPSLGQPALCPTMQVLAEAAQDTCQVRPWQGRTGRPDHMTRPLRLTQSIKAVLLNVPLWVNMCKAVPRMCSCSIQLLHTR